MSFPRTHNYSFADQHARVRTCYNQATTFFLNAYVILSYLHMVNEAQLPSLPYIQNYAHMVNEAWPTRHSCHVFHTFTINYAPSANAAATDGSASAAATAGGVDSRRTSLACVWIDHGWQNSPWRLRCVEMQYCMTSAEIRCLKYPGPLVPPKPWRGTSRLSAGTPSKYSTRVVFQVGCSIHTDLSLRFNKKSQDSAAFLPFNDLPAFLAALCRL